MVIDIGEEIRFIDLFGGVGGFRIGLERANSELCEETEPNRSKSTSNGRRRRQFEKTTFRCVWYNDIDKYAVKTYNKNFKENWEPKDIRSVKVDEIPNHDLLCAGFPCQSFSIAGKRKGFQDTRGTLFFEICRIIQAKRPKMVLLENVKGLLSHDSYRTFRVILESLRELGYVGQYQVLNSKDFGVPQNRERVFIFGFRGESCPKIFPLREGSQETVQIRKNNEGQETAWALRERDYKDGTNFVRTPLKFLSRNQKEIDGDYAFTVDSANTGGIKEGSRIRRLTPIECERLQGFSDNWTEGVSDTQRYKQMGNAVTVNIIEAIGRKMLVTFAVIGVK